MNKTMIVAVMSILMVSTVNAYTLIDNDNFSYTIGGDFEIQLGRVLGPNEDVDVIFDDSVVKNKLAYKLDNGNTVFSHLDFDLRNDEIVEKFFIGTTFANSSVLIGKNDNAADSFGIEGGRLNPAGGGDAFSVTHGDDLIMLQSKMKNTTLKISHDLAVGDGNETDTVFFVSSKFDKIGVGLAYQRYEEASTAAIAGDKGDVWGIQASMAMGGFTLAADYSEKDSDTKANDTTVSNLLGAYKKNKNIFWLGLTERDQINDATTGWYAGINHRLRPNVNVFAEVAADNAPDNEIAFITGVRLKF